MKYRKKPVVIDAEVYSEGMEDGVEESYISFNFNNQIVNRTIFKPYIQTLEGKMFISKGDYIITGIKGERYPCKPDIFKATYEEVPTCESNNTQTE